MSCCTWGRTDGFVLIRCVPIRTGPRLGETFWRRLTSETVPKSQNQHGGFGAFQPPAMNYANGSFGGEQETAGSNL